MSLHITEFEGGKALSDFRIQQLLPRLQAVHPKIAGLAARLVHLVACDQVPDAAELKRLAAEEAVGATDVDVVDAAIEIEGAQRPRVLVLARPRHTTPAARTIPKPR